MLFGTSVIYFLSMLFGTSVIYFLCNVIWHLSNLFFVNVIWHLSDLLFVQCYLAPFSLCVRVQAYTLCACLQYEVIIINSESVQEHICQA